MRPSYRNRDRLQLVPGGAREPWTVTLVIPLHLLSQALRRLLVEVDESSLKVAQWHKSRKDHLGLYNNPPPKNLVKPRAWSRDCCREPKKR